MKWFVGGKDSRKNVPFKYVLLGNSLSIRHECKSASVCRKKQRVLPCTTIPSQILYVFVWMGFSCVLKYVGQICWCRLLNLHVCARILKHMYIHMMCNIRHAKKILRTFCTVTTLSYKILEVGLYIFVMHVKENFKHDTTPARIFAW